MHRHWPYLWNGHRVIRTRGIKTEYRYGWGPTRHLGFPTMLERLGMAWRVFTGEYDAVTWEEPYPASSQREPSNK